MSRADREVERTPDGRWVVVDGRRWRAQDPQLPADVRERLLHHLGVGRHGVRAARGDDAAVAAARARVQLAKTGLGERGPTWWEQTDDERRARWEDALAALDDLP
ncbi:biopolymer transporter Tol [Klenkia sp. LSe6-5]|uniref:Biopolymer transporter Tol n=1 Tax=Klenkia sesuvii TaxID=3103137 RepID=A0ABU8DW51_9ACTN